MSAFEFVLDFLSSLSFTGENPRATDEDLALENKARCGIRAVSGRVLDIGTEWSEGICEVSAHHLRFVPSMGIVGDRDIAVEGIRLATGNAAPGHKLGGGTSVTLVITSTEGDLYFSVMKRLVPAILKRLEVTADEPI